MPKTFLITGGTGFIGAALIRALVNTGARVRSLDDDSRGSRGRLSDLSGKVEFVVGDVRDPAAVNKAIEGVDSVCHLAAVNGTRFFYSKPDVVLDVAVRGILNVIEACKKNQVRQLTVMSSSEVYQTPPLIPTPEEVPLVVPDPRNARYSYGCGKILSEVLALHTTGASFDRICIVRPHNVYGPQMGEEHVIPELVLRILKEKASSKRIKLPIQGTGEETRAFVYIDDMIQGFIKVLTSGEHREIYNIGTMQETSIATIAKMIAKSLNCEIEIVPGQRPAGSTLRRCPDITKITQLGYRPTFSLEKGIALTARWYAENAASRV